MLWKAWRSQFLSPDWPLFYFPTLCSKKLKSALFKREVRDGQGPIGGTRYIYTYIYLVFWVSALAEYQWIFFSSYPITLFNPVRPNLWPPPNHSDPSRTIHTSLEPFQIFPFLEQLRPNPIRVNSKRLHKYLIKIQTTLVPFRAIYRAQAVSSLRIFQPL